MGLTTCRECKQEVSTQARSCAHCGVPYPARAEWNGTGIDWKTEATILGYPLVHVAFGRDTRGKLRVARGFIAIGQFAFGAITIAQFGIGLVFGFGQFIVGPVAVAQFAVGYVAVGQFVLAFYGLAQLGIAKYLWSTHSKDVEAVEFFRQLASRIGILPRP